MATLRTKQARPPLKQARPPRLGRRAFLAVATAGVCGAGVVAAPRVAPFVEDRIHQAELNAVSGEISHLEGVSLDAAIQAAEITRAAVQIIVLPAARLVAAVGDGGLGLVLHSLDIAHAALSFAHAPTTPLDDLRAVVASWQQGMTALPIALTSYTTADITSAEVYLKALKSQVARANDGETR